MNKEKQTKANKYFKRFFWAVFLFYLLILIKIVLLKDTDLSAVPKFLTGEKKGFRSFNLIPFQTFLNFSRIAGSGNFLWIISNLLGNSLIFLPFGYLLALLKSPKISKRKILFLSALLSLFFETSQYVFYLGSADIDDLLLNVLGAAAGILCFHILTALCRNDLHRIYLISLILGLLSFAGAGAIAYVEFGSRLGLVHYKSTVIGGEDIPKKEPGYTGYFMSGSDRKLRCTSDTDEAFGDPSVINITPETKVFHLSYEKEKTSFHQINTVYKRYSLSQLKSVKKHSKVSVWFTKNGRNADIIVLSDPVNTDSESVKADGAYVEKKELNGTVISIGKETFVISKINTYDDKKNGGQIAESTDIHITVKYKKDLKVTVCDAYNQGTKTSCRKGSLKDLKKDRSVLLKGTVRDKIFYAESVTVYIFHK